ncbi:MAG TPA: RNA polymerase sigma factor [Vicinamibacterales bacterium]
MGGSGDAAPDVRDVIETVYRTESRRVLATLIRLLGDFDRAEEALHEAFSAAVEQWPRDGVPASPRAWLVSAGRFRAIDALRRRARFDASLAALATELEGQTAAPVEWIGEETLEDDRLRLIFTCCHPALQPDAQVALTLREVCGLTTEEIARAFLTAPRTVAQRIVRAKAKIRDAGIPYQVPGRTDLPDRLDAVLRVVYLVFNEGYSASSGATLTRHDLSGEAIRLGRLLVELLAEPEALGLLALMLLQESRRAARTSPLGEVVLLDAQDRSAWDRALIADGVALVERALGAGPPGPYALQAAIAAVHADAADAAATDWAQIVGLYDVLLRADASPVVELNRAAAVCMRDGPAAGLALIDALLARGQLADYQFAHSARADCCRRLGRVDEARTSYTKALELARQEPERRFLERRLREL